MNRMVFSIHCFCDLVLVFCKRGSSRGIGYGFTIDEALRNMVVYREMCNA